MLGQGGCCVPYQGEAYVFFFFFGGGGGGGGGGGSYNNKLTMSLLAFNHTLKD